MLNNNSTNPINEDINEDKKFLTNNYSLNRVISSLKYISKDLDEIKKELLELHSTQKS